LAFSATGGLHVLVFIRPLA